MSLCCICHGFLTLVHGFRLLLLFLCAALPSLSEAGPIPSSLLEQAVSSFADFAGSFLRRSGVGNLQIQSIRSFIALR
jgi:hypothetical protein